MDSEVQHLAPESGRADASQAQSGHRHQDRQHLPEGPCLLPLTAGGRPTRGQTRMYASRRHGLKRFTG